MLTIGRRSDRRSQIRGDGHASEAGGERGIEGRACELPHRSRLAPRSTHRS